MNASFAFSFIKSEHNTSNVLHVSLHGYYQIIITVQLKAVTINQPVFSKMLEYRGSYQHHFLPPFFECFQTRQRQPAYAPQAERQAY